MIKINFSAGVICPFGLPVVKKTVARAARMEKKIKGEVEINVIGDGAMQKMNKQYRGKNKTTDVLSFAWQETGEKNNLGQIFISYPQIKRQAAEYKVSEKEEFTRMLVHGLLHLVGYDHLEKKDEEIMFDLQEKIIKKI